MLTGWPWEKRPLESQKSPSREQPEKTTSNTEQLPVSGEEWLWGKGDRAEGGREATLFLALQVPHKLLPARCRNFCEPGRVGVGYEERGANDRESGSFRLWASFSKNCICRHGGSACALSRNVDKTEAPCLLGQPDLHIEVVSKTIQESCVYGIISEKSHLHLELTSITRAFKWLCTEWDFQRCQEENRTLHL